MAHSSYPILPRTPAAQAMEHVFGAAPVRAAIDAGRRRILRLFVAASVRALKKQAGPSWEYRGACPAATPSVFAQVECERTLREAESEQNVLANPCIAAGGIAEIAHEARLQSIPVQFTSRAHIEKLCPSHNHQGIALLASRLPQPPPWTHRLVQRNKATADSQPDTMLVLLLYRIQDPHNLGAVIRTAAFFGVQRIVLSESCAPLSPVASKASAGALEHLHDGSRILRTHSALAFVSDMRSAGWRVLAATCPPADSNLGGMSVHIATHRHAAERLSQSEGVCQDVGLPGTKIDAAAKLAPPTVLVLGNEGSGIPESVASACSGTVSIAGHSASPLLDSLNVSVSAGILIHHLVHSAIH